MFTRCHILQGVYTRGHTQTPPAVQYQFK